VETISYSKTEQLLLGADIFGSCFNYLLWLRDIWELWCRECHWEQAQEKTVEETFKENPRGQVLVNDIEYREFKV